MFGNLPRGHVRQLILSARDVRQETPRTRVITLDVSTSPFAFSAGQAVLAGLASASIRRPYSIACAPTQMRATGSIELLVQIDDHEAPDPHLERVERGTAVAIEGPFGDFVLPAALPASRLLLVAGGTGIAPLRAMLWQALDEHLVVDISVVYSARSAAEFAYLQELERLANDGRIRLSLMVTREDGTVWSGARGRVDAARLTSALANPDTLCIVCGPPPLVVHVSALLTDAGVPEALILRETYGQTV